MKVYLLRHGKAEDAGPGMTDRDRRLTDEGVGGIRAEVEGIKAKAPVVERIYSSPYPRAAETARIVAEAYGVEVEEFDALASAGMEDAVTKKVKGAEGCEGVMLVGHTPLLEDVAVYMCSEARGIALKKGGLCGVEFDGEPERGKGRLLFVLKPKELRGR